MLSVYSKSSKFKFKRQYLEADEEYTSKYYSSKPDTIVINLLVSKVDKELLKNLEIEFLSHPQENVDMVAERIDQAMRVDCDYW